MLSDFPTVKESHLSFYLSNSTAMSHCDVHSALGQKMRSLVGMPVFQVVQHGKSLKQLWVERIHGHCR